MVQTLARHKFHGDEAFALGGIDVVNVNDVGIAQRRGSFGLLHEATITLRIGDLRCWQHLNRHWPIQMRVQSAVDHTHSPGADFLQDVVVADRFADHAQLLYQI